jgi:circadian clock protein KaiC
MKKTETPKKFVFPKTPTGVDGLDEITEAVFPREGPRLYAEAPAAEKRCFPCSF